MLAEAIEVLIADVLFGVVVRRVGEVDDSFVFFSTHGDCWSWMSEAVEVVVFGFVDVVGSWSSSAQKGHFFAGGSLEGCDFGFCLRAAVKVRFFSGPPHCPKIYIGPGFTGFAAPACLRPIPRAA